jgi:glycosyltransferase involved in cell wall biosynthesis
MKLLFRKGPLFYAEYNIRLLIFLLTNKSNLLVANDLDTLAANFAAHKLRRIPIVYDSHEYYTETPELVNRPFVQGIWERIERFIFPKLTDIITVNQSIADLYEKKYGKKLKVVRNIPRLQAEPKVLSREECGLPADKHIILMQGAGINIQRGAEEAVEAMKYVDNAILLIVGGGDVIGKLKEMTKQLKLENKVIFKDRLPYSELIRHTRLADIGLTLDKNTNINYRFSLPNKLFDYIHAGIPVLASRLPEIARIVEGYNIGLIAESHDPEYIGNLFTNMLSDDESRRIWKKNLLHASSELTWEKEAETLIELYKKYV